MVDIINEYEKYIKDNKYRWKFCSDIMYDMCSKNPKHTDDDVVAGKILIIGRSYAAAVERCSGKGEMTNDNFYYNKICGLIRDIHDLDSIIEELNKSKSSIQDNIDKILGIHYRLSYAISPKNKNNFKRSFTSKYLHFHCPNHFFIYDERAKQALNKIITTCGIKIDKNIEIKSICDQDYKKFVIKMVSLQEYIKDKLPSHNLPSPIQLDRFLLYYWDKENKKDD